MSYVKIKILEFIFNQTDDSGFSPQDVRIGIHDQRISDKKILSIVYELAQKGAIFKIANTNKFVLINHSKELLYSCLNVEFEVEEELHYSNQPSGYVYAYYYEAYKTLAQMNDVTQFPMKIGFTSRAYPLLRIYEQLTTSTPEVPKIALLFGYDQAYRLEQAIHSYYKLHHQHFHLNPNNEWFNTNPHELKKLITLLIEDQF